MPRGRVGVFAGGEFGVKKEPQSGEILWCPFSFSNEHMGGFPFFEFVVDLLSLRRSQPGGVTLQTAMESNLLCFSFEGASLEARVARPKVGCLFSLPEFMNFSHFVERPCLW